MKHLKTYESYVDNLEEYLYHGTSYKNAMNIIDNGFSENTYWGSRSNAEGYAYSYSKPVLIKILKSDIIDVMEPNYTLIEYYEDNLEEDDNEDVVKEWNNSNKTTEDSLRIFDSVILPPTYYNLSKDDIERI